MSNLQALFLNCCSRAVQLALPPACALCGADAAHGRLCGPCEAALPKLPDAACRVCALPLTSGTTCGECLRQPPAYDRVCAAYAYAFPIDALIHAYKYRGNLALAGVLAAQLPGPAVSSVDALIPMPLAPRRLRERGFNQALELARLIGRRCGVPVLSNACRKVADTVPQAALPWTERARNVRGAFVCDADLDGLRVTVVDDVMTTGATMNELARNLKRAGAREVSAWVLARTLRA